MREKNKQLTENQQIKKIINEIKGANNVINRLFTLIILHMLCVDEVYIFIDKNLP